MVDSTETVRKTAEQVITDYLINAPEQSDWPWEDHCNGLAGGIIVALKAHGYQIAEAARLGTTLDIIARLQRHSMVAAVISNRDWSDAERALLAEAKERSRSTD